MERSMGSRETIPHHLETPLHKIMLLRQEFIPQVVHAAVSELPSVTAMLQ